MVDKITAPVTPLGLVNKTNEIIDALGSSGGSVSWGEIEGTLSNQTDLQNALNGKQSSATAVIHTASTAVGSATQPVYVASDGTATVCTYSLAKSVPSDAVFTDTTYSDFIGANGLVAGTAGLVPAPAATDDTKFLKGDGTWAVPAGASSTKVNTLFSVNSGNVNSSGEGDLIGTANYTETTQNNYTFVGDDLPTNTTDGVITCGWNGTPISPNASTFDFADFFTHSNWRVTIKVKRGNDTDWVNIALCKGRNSGGHSYTDVALVAEFASGAATSSAYAGYYIYNGSTKGSRIAYDISVLNYNSQYVYFSLMRNGETLYIQQSTDGETWTTLASFAYTDIINTSNITRFYFCVARKCTVDLKETYVEVGGVEVWRGYATVSKINTLDFKIGDTYPSITVTNGQNQQFTVDEAEALDLSQATDGNYTAYVTPEGEIYANKGTVYVQDSEPVMTTDDVWFDTSVYPYKAVQSDETTEFADVPFATFTIATQTNGSVLLTNPQTLPYNRFQVTTAQIDAINTVLSGKQDSSTAVTHTASTAVGSATQGVYIASDGTATAMTYAVNKDVPSDAVFTDTTYANGTGITIGTGNAINHSNSVSAGTVGTSSATSGSTLAVPYVTYDAQGHITATGTHTHTITGFLTSISSSDVTTALGYTPYNSTNPSGYQANVIETIKVNGTAQTITSKTVDITVPSEVTELTVSGWGFTKNAGTVTSVNNVSPVNGNVTLTIPFKISDLTDDTATYPVDKADTLTNLAASVTELNYVDGVTSNIQTQLDGKLSTKPDGTNNIIDSNNKITTKYLPDVVLGQMLYAGVVDSIEFVAPHPTLTTNAKTKLGTTLDSISLTNNTNPITGYVANEGCYYICACDFIFAGISFLIGDWLLSTGSGWTKVDNTDAVTGVKGNAESTYRTGNVNITADNVLPTQTSNSGKFLTTNGTTASWANVPTEIPTQTGNSGKFLTTNGTSVSWASITIPTKISDLTDDTATYPVDKADTLTGLTASIAELNIMDGVTASTAELNILDGVTATTTELNYVDGVTSSIQTQLDNKVVKLTTAPTAGAYTKVTITSAGLVSSGGTLQASDIPSLTLAKISDVTATASELNVLDGITASTAELNILDGVTASTAEINILDGVTVTASEINSVTSKIGLSDLSIDSGSTNYLSYSSSTGKFSASVDTTPTNNSSKLITSGGVYTALGNKQDSSTAVKHTASTAVGSGTQPVYIASDGTATATTYALNKTVPSDAVFTDTTYSAFTGATSGTAGAAGLVPAPSSGETSKFLKSDGTWGTPVSTGVSSVVTGSTNGTISVTTNGTTSSVSVYGLGTAAYTDVTSTYSSTGTAPVNGTAVASALTGKTQVTFRTWS